MCMFCAAIPVTAAAGVALDNSQRRKFQREGRPTPRLRLFLLLTVVGITLLMIGSVIYHFLLSRWL
jgi:hypothetical protein